MVENSSDELIELLTRHKSQLFSYIVSIVHHMADAEDVFQQTCTVVWEKFDQFEVGTDFMAWAATIAHHKSVHFLRTQKRERRGFSSELQSQLTARQTDDDALHLSRRRGLEHCTEMLPESDRRLINLCYQRGVKVKNVADEIGRPVGSVYDSLSRIRRKLFECIERYVVQEGLE